MAILWFIMLLFALSVFFSACCKKRFAESLPVSFFAIVLILFLFALAGYLRLGVRVLILLCGVLALVGVLYAVRKKEWLAAWQRLATPATLLFLAAVVWSVYTSYGRVADAWDEFSHWADTVKRMVVLHAIPTAADGAQFPSYPPAMALLQYFVQMLDGRALPFTEWQLYVTYQMFSAAILLPMFDRLSARDGVLRFLLAAVLLFMLPTVLFYHPIGKLFIDCFLGLLFGCALAFAMGKKADAFEWAGFCLSLFVLTLTKEVGLLFALLAAASVIIGELAVPMERKTGMCSLKRMVPLLLPFAAIAAAKLLWNGFAANGSAGLDAVRSGVIDVLREAPNVAVAVAKNYVQNFFSFTQRVGMMKMSFFTLLVLCMTMLAALLLFRSRVEAPSYPRVRFRMLAAGASLLIYIGSLLFLYVTWSVYSPYEAENLSSFDRYLNTAFLAFLVCLARAAWDSLYLADGKCNKPFAAIIAVAALLLLPLPDMMELGLRKTVNESVETRAPYLAAAEEAERLGLKNGETVLVVVQDTAGYEYQTMRYCLQPQLAVDGYRWSFRLPGDTNNIWTTYFTPEEFCSQFDADYQYLLLFQLDAYFYENYVSCFADGTEIREGGWYRQDATSGLLVSAEG